MSGDAETIVETFRLLNSDIYEPPLTASMTSSRSYRLAFFTDLSQARAVVAIDG